MLLRLTIAIFCAAFALEGRAADFLEAKFPNGATVQIHLTGAHCPKDKKLAVWVDARREKQVNGCYSVSGDGVLTILWDDGDKSEVWAKVFRPADGV